MSLGPVTQASIPRFSTIPTVPSPQATLLHAGYLVKCGSAPLCAHDVYVCVRERELYCLYMM